MPTSPADLAGSTATLLKLLDQYYEHSLVLVGARTDTPTAQPADLLVRHAIAALAINQVIVDDLLSERASLVRDAFDHGATGDQLRAALGGTFTSVLDTIVEHMWSSRGAL